MRSLGGHFHAPVPAVTHPAGQSQFFGAFQNEKAKADTLDHAGDQRMQAEFLVLGH